MSAPALAPHGTVKPAQDAYQSPKAATPSFLPSSLYRKIRYVFCKAIGCLASLLSCLKPNLANIENPKQILSNGGEGSLIQQLRKRNRLDSSLIDLLKNTEEVEGCSILRDLMMPQPVQKPYYEIVYNFSKNLTAIPVVINPGHIVCFLVDKINHTIEYFDSEGLSIQDRDATVRGQTNVTLKKLAEHIYQRCVQFDHSSSWTLSENAQLMQYDIHNCGMFVADFIHRRFNEESLEDIQKNPLSYWGADSTSREKFMDKLKPDFSAAPQLIHHPAQYVVGDEDFAIE